MTKNVSIFSGRDSNTTEEDSCYQKPITLVNFYTNFTQQISTFDTARLWALLF